MKLYLQQFLSQAGIASRRQATELIKKGQVKVNQRVAELGMKIDPLVDQVRVKRRLVQPPLAKVYYLVNKPVGYTCTLKDKHARRKITDLVPAKPKVWPVGRLDKNSRGLIILTNDGELTQHLTHPKFKHPKEYVVKLNKAATPELLSKLRRGVKLAEGLARADKVKMLGHQELKITIHQGWKRQIRRMLKAVGYQVLDLQRIAIGQWKLGGLKEGDYKKIKISNYSK